MQVESYACLTGVDRQTGRFSLGTRSRSAGADNVLGVLSAAC